MMYAKAEGDGDWAKEINTVLHAGGASYPLFFRSNEAQMRLTPEADVLAQLIPSMATETPLASDAALDPQFLSHLNEAQSVLSSWVDVLNHVGCDALSAGDVAAPPEGARRVASFFTGGADSFYTLLENLDEITDIVFVHGFDIKLSDTVLLAQSVAMVDKVAAAFGKRVIHVETNMRPILDTYLGWSYTHGAALATIAHLFSDVFSRVYIAASDTYPALAPWGSHPMLDPLWSSSKLKFIHHGADKNRTEKIIRVAESEIALKTLRVCWMNYDGAYNCGRCEKCQRTMIDLRIAGALERCTTFSAPLRLSNVLAIDGGNQDVRIYYQDSLRLAEEVGKDKELISALRTMLRDKSQFGRFRISLMRAVKQPRRAIARIARKLGI